MPEPDLSVVPVVAYPKVAERGRSYLMTVDMASPPDQVWSVPEEEIEIGFVIDGSPLYTSRPLGTPSVIVHRFGGTYGAARFVLTAGDTVGEGPITLTILNPSGLPAKALRLASRIDPTTRPVKYERRTMRLTTDEVTGAGSWTWRLFDPSGRLRARHRVEVDPAVWEWQALNNLPASLAGHVDPENQFNSEHARIVRVGEFTARELLGPTITQILVDDAPVTVVVVVPPDRPWPLTLSLGIARVDGQNLASRRIEFVRCVDDHDSSTNVTACDVGFLHRQFDPLRPLAVDDFEAYVDWQHEVDSGTPDVKSRLVRAFSRDGRVEQPTTRLLTGHRGVGKTTELNRVSARLRDGEGGRRVFVSTLFAQRWLDIDDVQSEDLVLQIVRQLAADLTNVGMNLGTKVFQAFWERLMVLWLDEVERGPDPLNFSFTLKDYPNEREAFRKRLRGQLPFFFDMVNRDLIPAARKYLHTECGFDDILLVVDDLDKIPQRVLTDRGMTNHENLFLDNAAILQAISCNLLLTIPIELAYSPAQARLQDYYGSSILFVPLVPVRTRAGEAVEKGELALRDVVGKRANIAGCTSAGIFEDDQLLLRVLRLSGGHMRTLIVLIAEMLDWTDDLPLTSSLVERYVSRTAKNMGRALFEADWDLLDRARNSVAPVHEEPRFFHLLRDQYLLACEDGDDYWYGWNPLIEEIDRDRPIERPS